MKIEIQCPECGREIPVPIAEIVADDDGACRLVPDSDMADLWAHSWVCASDMVAALPDSRPRRRSWTAILLGRWDRMRGHGGIG